MFLCSQEITQGVRSSTRAVRLAEERLRRLTNMTPPNINPSGSGSYNLQALFVTLKSKIDLESLILCCLYLISFTAGDSEPES